MRTSSLHIQCPRRVDVSLLGNPDRSLSFVLLCKSQGNQMSVPITSPEAESDKGRPLTVSCEMYLHWGIALRWGFRDRRGGGRPADDFPEAPTVPRLRRPVISTGAVETRTEPSRTTRQNFWLKRCMHIGKQAYPNTTRKKPESTWCQLLESWHRMRREQHLSF